MVYNKYLFILIQGINCFITESKLSSCLAIRSHAAIFDNWMESPFICYVLHILLGCVSLHIISKIQMPLVGKYG